MWEGLLGFTTYSPKPPNSTPLKPETCPTLSNGCQVGLDAMSHTMGEATRRPETIAAPSLLDHDRCPPPPSYMYQPSHCPLLLLLLPPTPCRSRSRSRHVVLPRV